jgi:hypothetical protein
MVVRQRSKHELVAALQGRYRRADRASKARLLDEFCAATGYHRKARDPSATGWSASAACRARWPNSCLFVRRDRRPAGVR